MAEIEPIPVYYEAYEIGNLQVNANGALSFTYNPLWLETKRAFPISVTMPLSSDVYGPETVQPWIANLLPEERQLAALVRVLGVDKHDSLAILKEIGGDTAGALSFGEPSLRDQWNYQTLESFYGVPDPTEALARHFEDLKERPFLANEEGIRLSLAGGQEKTTLAVLTPDSKPRLGLPAAGDHLAIPRDGAPSTVIIKPDNPNLPGIVENEAYCLALARAIGIEAAEACILNAGKRTALAVARYDRENRQDGSIRRLHQEDFAQANRVFPTNKYESGTVPGPSLQTLLATGDNLPPRDALRLIDQIIFNILVANTDAHAKNYSLLLAEERAMAPLYDVSTALPWKERKVIQTFAQKIAGKKRRPADIQSRHWDVIAESADLNARELKRRIQELVDRIVKAGPAVADQVTEQAGAIKGFVDQAQVSVEHNALRIAQHLRDTSAHDRS